jgi:pyruvate/2-oxoglutarate dehydrogenase complex dihydrolipoamide acyltransferase (E2) component
MDQLLFSMETDKAGAPVNAPSPGTVKSILVRKGDVVAVGTDMLVLSSDAAGASAGATATAAAAAPSKPQPKTAPPPPGTDEMFL